ncbi:MAG: Deoxyuridine 5'-triphosphate nucleotidohydrolase [Candidatus Heimdallarchaeota archaeon LC_2]|nr:MAG: Deoxyuridine 5'-triphosphate nucleotidohydrolase [Candidatus Heimdallarchaeota archaeon LC_2]
MAILTPNQIGNAVRDMLDKTKQIQHAGVDLTVNKIEKFVGEGFLAQDNKDRVLPDIEEMKIENGIYQLNPGGYIVRYNESIHVPLNAAALTLPRSSLMRSGATIHSAVWDPGYEGKGMGLLTVFHKIKIQKNSRIAQIIFFSLSNEVKTGYSGTYQGEGFDR